MHPNRRVSVLAKAIGVPQALRDSYVHQETLALLMIFSILRFVLGQNCAILKTTMGNELGLTTGQFGYVLGSFTAGYALFQMPAGDCGDRRGPRFVLTRLSVAWFVPTVLMGIIPGLIVYGSAASFAALLSLQFLLGALMAGMYPIAAKAVRLWFPISEHAFANAVVLCGAAIGLAIAQPLIAGIMKFSGWRAAFYLTSVLPLPVAYWWWKQAKAPSAANPCSEIIQSQGNSIDEVAGASRVFTWRGAFLEPIQNRNVLILSARYCLESYVLSTFFNWLFTYLTDERKLDIMTGAWGTSMPFITAAIALPTIGLISDRWSNKYGYVVGRRIVPMVCLASCAVLLWIGVAAATPLWITVGAFSMSVGLLFSTEGLYWSLISESTKDKAGASGGFMNMTGNLGSFLSAVVGGRLLTHVGWHPLFACAAGCAVASSLLWVLIRVEAPTSATTPRSA
jgi:ACS family glucarate transporter-like MFS transporter